MRIVYGVAGEGRGHLSRSREIINHLKSEGHELLIITYGQAYASLSKNFTTIKINGIHPIIKSNKMKLIQSHFTNTPRVLKDLARWKQINKQINAFSPDLFITDFEPYTARLAYRNKKPLISIDNQHLLLQEIPQHIKKAHYKDFIVSKYASKFCVPKADLFIILSLFNIELKTKKAIIIPPVIKSEIRNAKPKKGNHILVYLSKPDDALLDTLRKIPEHFIIYGYNMNSKDKNLTFKKDNENFIKNISSCKAVLATAGFSLISESIFLKKPYFALPYYHFEQTLNAYFIKEQGLGEFSKKPTESQIKKFLANLKVYEVKLKRLQLIKQNSLELISKAVRDNSKKRLKNLKNS